MKNDKNNILNVLFYRLKSQIPEIKQTLEILKHMQKKKVSTASP